MGKKKPPVNNLGRPVNPHSREWEELRRTLGITRARVGQSWRKFGGMRSRFQTAIYKHLHKVFGKVTPEHAYLVDAAEQAHVHSALVWEYMQEKLKTLTPGEYLRFIEKRQAFTDKRTQCLVMLGLIDYKKLPDNSDKPRGLGLGADDGDDDEGEDEE